MVRVTNGLGRQRRHKKFINQAKGFRLGRKNLYKQVRLALVKQGQHAYVSRRLKKRDFRKLWIERLSAVIREKGNRYSVFVNLMNTKDIKLDRKVLSNIAVAFPSVFDKIYAARQFNSGRYNFSEVFGANLNDTLITIEKNFDADFVLEIFRKRLLIYYYPANIIRIRNGLSAVRNENCFRNLYKIYKKFPSFWIFTVSAMWIPKKLGLLIVKFMQKTI